MNLLHYHHARNSECLPRQAFAHRLHRPLEHDAEQPDEKAQRDLKRRLEEPTKPLHRRHPIFLDLAGALPSTLFFLFREQSRRLVRCALGSLLSEHT